MVLEDEAVNLVVSLSCLMRPRHLLTNNPSECYSIALMATLGTLSSALVIDDSHWNTHPLQLSDGWNMLRPDQTEAIDPFQVSLMRPLLPNFFNRSIRYVHTPRREVVR